MTDRLYRRRGESQVAFVERVLRERGRISAYEAIYSVSWAEDGSPRGARITRLAVAIHTLRGRGLPIESSGAKGRTATYWLAA